MLLLITGSAGFIGFHLSKALLEKGYHVIGIDNYSDYYDTQLKNDRVNQLNKLKNFEFIEIDITSKSSLEKIFIKYKPNKVINLAAQPGVQYSIENPYEYMNSNLVGFLNIIEMCRHFEVNGFIYASSSSVYGNTNTPFNVEDKTDSPISFYGATKKANELIAHSYSSLYDLNTTGLRYFTVYGPWYRPDMAINIFTEKIINQEKITIYNEGNLKRDFTYIDDIIEGTISSIEKNFKYEIFNLGNNKKEKILDVIKIIESELDKNAIIEFEPIKKGDMLESWANIDYSKKKLNYNPKTSINKGIPKFIKWYRDYYDK